MSNTVLNGSDHSLLAALLNMRSKIVRIKRHINPRPVNGCAMPSRFLPLLAWALLPGAVAAQAPTHRLVVADHQTIQAGIGYDLRSRDFVVQRWIAYIAEPPELPSQGKVKVTCEPAGKVVAEKSPLARKVRVFDVPVAKPASGARLVLKQDVQAVLRSRKLEPLEADEKPPAVPALTAAERKWYTAVTRRYDFDKVEFKNWLDFKKLNRKKGESAIDFASRLLAVIREDYAYRFDPAEEKRASVTCERGATDCGGMSILFASAMRAHDIPARTLVGRFAKPRREGAVAGELDYDQPHARVEFHVPGIGWIPVDPTYANRGRDKPVSFYVGHDPGDLLVQHVDFDLRLPVLDKEQSTDLLQIEPLFFAMGRGKLDVFLGPSRWELKTTSIAK